MGILQLSAVFALESSGAGIRRCGRVPGWWEPVQCAARGFVGSRAAAERRVRHGQLLFGVWSKSLRRATLYSGRRPAVLPARRRAQSPRLAVDLRWGSLRRRGEPDCRWPSVYGDRRGRARIFRRDAARRSTGPLVARESGALTCRRQRAPASARLCLAAGNRAAASGRLDGRNGATVLRRCSAIGCSTTRAILRTGWPT